MKKLLVIFIACTFSLAGCKQTVLEKPVSTLVDQSQESLSSDRSFSPKPSESPLPTTGQELTPIGAPPETGLETEKPSPSDQLPDETNQPGAETPLPETFFSQPPWEYPDTELASSAYATYPNEKYGWYFNRNQDHQPPTAQRIVDLSQYNACYLEDTEDKVLYLTFDEGYENGYTSVILDVLAEKNVQAAFFLTSPYIRSQPELVMRMVAEGHVTANHSVRHLSMPDLSPEEMAEELTGLADTFAGLYPDGGVSIAPFFRPPMGEYSERSLAVTRDCGYFTVFWSFAYMDWDVNDQPGKESAYNTVMQYIHNGAIILLHAVSSSNAEALSDIIDAARAEGYRFASLYELPGVLDHTN